MKPKLKLRLKAGERVVGTMITLFDNVQIARILNVAGFDFFVIDCEHGSYDYNAVGGMVAVAREIGIPAIVRIPELRREVVLKYLELGASGLLLPNTETVQQAEFFVKYAKYAPLGERGVSLFRPHTGYEKLPDPAAYMNQANNETLLIAQIESRQAVANAEAILAVAGIDAAFIGPSDLSHSLGIMGQLKHPEFIQAVDTVVAAAKKHGKYSGIHCMSAIADLQHWTDKGMTLNLWMNEVLLLMKAAQQDLVGFKTAHSQTAPGNSHHAA
jgi:2-dehydro-3-deoxyglucarate aldolase/4-hydroxy-2-oxoheptanedioate aldolase